MNNKVLTTTSQVIDALGGNAKAAELLGVGYTSITNWRMFNRFPAVTYVQIQHQLKQRRLAASDKLWRMRSNHRSRVG
jgi:hypothetical protein